MVADEIYEAMLKPKVYRDQNGKFHPFYPLIAGLIARKGENWAWELLSEIKEYRILKKKRYPIDYILQKSKNEDA